MSTMRLTPDTIDSALDEVWGAPWREMVYIGPDEDPESYAFKLSSEARRFSLVKSELRTGINRVIKLVSWLLIPTAVLLVSSQLAAHDGVVGAIQASTAGLVAMVPEGLVLLTSIAFAVGATRLASKKSSEKPGSKRLSMPKSGSGAFGLSACRHPL